MSLMNIVGSTSIMSALDDEKDTVECGHHYKTDIVLARCLIEMS